MSPYRFGDRAIKFSAKPQLESLSIRPNLKSKHYLHEVMVQQLQSQTVYFDFLIQFQTDPIRMPIEDPTIEWDETLSPYRKVATIKIPPQAFNSADQMQFCENLSFTPWHALPEHQPLGGINRMRRKVYEATAKVRHELNHTPQREPDIEDLLN